MDFKRIEWIFLIVFIGINIFLGIEIFQTPTLLSPPTSSGTAADLNTEMKADNIKLPKVVNKEMVIILLQRLMMIVIKLQEHN